MIDLGCTDDDSIDTTLTASITAGDPGGAFKMTGLQVQVDDGMWHIEVDSENNYCNYQCIKNRIFLSLNFFKKCERFSFKD